MDEFELRANHGDVPDAFDACARFGRKAVPRLAELAAAHLRRSGPKAPMKLSPAEVLGLVAAILDGGDEEDEGELLRRMDDLALDAIYQLGNQLHQVEAMSRARALLEHPSFTADAFREEYR